MSASKRSAERDLQEAARKIQDANEREIRDAILALLYDIHKQQPKAFTLEWCRQVAHSRGYRYESTESLRTAMRLALKRVSATG